MASFTRSGSTPFWTLDGAPGWCTVAYTPFDLTRPPGETVTLTDSWQQYPGSYLFAPADTPLDQPLAGQLAAFRAGRPLRLVWVTNPQQPAANWQASWLASDGSVVTGLASLSLGSVALWIGAGCPIAPDAGGADLVVGQRSGDPGSIYFTTGFGAASVLATSAVTLPFSATQAGCAVTGLTLNNGSAPSDLDRLDVGLRIFATDPAVPQLPDRLASWRYPVFQSVQSGVAAQLPVTLSVHPLRPLDPALTYIQLVPAAVQNVPQLKSCYVTTNGYGVQLGPLNNAPAQTAKLVLAVRALSDGPSAQDPYYFVPSGAFAITVVDGKNKPVGGAQQLMCGISGIEYIQVQPDSELWFSPGGAALAVGKGLQPTATTAYASVYGPGGSAGALYRAQADSAALFAPAGAAGFMSFRELAGMSLPAATGGGLPAGYPMLPYTGISAHDLTPYQQLEYQAVSATRRAAIGTLTGHAKAVQLAGGATTPSITPQGLQADVDGNGNVVNVTLAKSLAGPLTMQQITGNLAAALQSNQLFLVASDPSTLAAVPPANNGTVQIPSSPTDASQVWTIDSWPSNWSASNTLLVLKFAGKPLSVLAADTDSWAGDKGSQFNPGTGGVQAAQSVLQALINQAKNSKDPEFAPFAALADDPHWQGVLFLNAPVPPAQLPSEIAGLAAGIDASAFKAHHLGLTVTPSTVSGGTISQTASSLFGLVFYQSPNSAAGAQPPYAFNVLNLKVRFENSLVRTFASQIELLVDQLFGEAANLADPATMQELTPNVLVLDGVYQQQGNTGGYTFSTAADNLFVLDSAVLDTVEVTAAQFVTVIPPDPKQPSKPAESRFVLTGAMRYLPPKPGQLDVFSFGPSSVATPADRLSTERLFYTNLWISLDYIPADRSKDVYTFDASHLVLDSVQSVARQTSLFAGFPLTLASFVHVPTQPAGDSSKQPATPASLGFLGIGTTPPLGGSITAPWFGIVADLGFGTAGALAAAAGFKASMLMSWSPGSAANSANAGIGLKLPGTGTGGKLLSLQGVLKLKIGQLSLSQNDGIYLLELDRIAIGVLMLTIPQSGQVDALLFADPTGKDHTTLGWYAGYAKTGGS
ncbi:MAG TPA: hypothetical protein VJ851_14210 [Jatrophihabitans sp.]|nr:hypothetical protein [Jatrophihabitans sp.]